MRKRQKKTKDGRWGRRGWVAKTKDLLPRPKANNKIVMAFDGR